MIHLRAKVHRSTGSTRHLLASAASDGIDVTRLPDPVAVEIVEENGSFLLLRLDGQGQCIADTWHATLEAARAQAVFEYEIAVDAWRVLTEERERAREIAIRTLAGEYDPLLACIDLNALRSHLEDAPEDVLDTFLGIASEVDDLPLGSQRQYWAPEALATKDVRAARYREQVRDLVVESLRQLLASLEGADS